MTDTRDDHPSHLALRFVNEHGGRATDRDNVHIERRAHGNEVKHGEWVRITTEPIQRADVADFAHLVAMLSPSPKRSPFGRMIDRLVGDKP